MEICNNNSLPLNMMTMTNNNNKRRRIIFAIIAVLSILSIAVVVVVLVIPQSNSNNNNTVSLNVHNVTLHNSVAQQPIEQNNTQSNNKTRPSHQSIVSSNTTTTKNQGFCSLDMSLDANLLHISCPRINNANQGFAMDTTCKNGEHCVYACEPPFVSSSNGWSNDDCVPYEGRCNQVYDPAVYKGGLYCNNNGQIEVSNPALPLCVPGLNTSYITSNLPSIISSCQTVYPGNEAPMIGLEIQAGQTKQITSFPQDYWQQTHAHFYISLGSEKRREEACQWNYDPLSLNSGGVDSMPFIVGGGALLKSPCKECGQHNMDFGENFDYNKSYSGLPNFGIRARNCNDEKCGKVLCDATYRFNSETQELERYWVKYNTVYGADNVGCVTDAVAGNAWNGDVNNVNKYTKFEYYEIDITTGNDRKCGSNGIECFNHNTCSKIVNAKNANHGTGKNPATYACTPVDGAATFTLVTLKSSENDTDVKLPNQTKTLYTIAIIGCVVMIIAGFVVRRIQENKSTPVPTTPLAIVNLNFDSNTPRHQSIHSEVPYVMA